MGERPPNQDPSGAHRPVSSEDQFRQGQNHFQQNYVQMMLASGGNLQRIAPRMPPTPQQVYQQQMNGFMGARMLPQFPQQANNGQPNPVFLRPVTNAGIGGTLVMQGNGPVPTSLLPVNIANGVQFVVGPEGFYQNRMYLSNPAGGGPTLMAVNAMSAPQQQPQQQQQQAQIMASPPQQAVAQSSQVQAQQAQQVSVNDSSQRPPRLMSIPDDPESPDDTMDAPPALDKVGDDDDEEECSIEEDEQAEEINRELIFLKEQKTFSKLTEYDKVLFHEIDGFSIEESAEPLPFSPYDVLKCPEESKEEEVVEEPQVKIPGKRGRRPKAVAAVAPLAPPPIVRPRRGAKRAEVIPEPESDEDISETDDNDDQSDISAVGTHQPRRRSQRHEVVEEPKKKNPRGRPKRQSRSSVGNYKGMDDNGDSDDETPPLKIASTSPNPDDSADEPEAVRCIRCHKEMPSRASSHRHSKNPQYCSSSCRKEHLKDRKSIDGSIASSSRSSPALHMDVDEPKQTSETPTSEPRKTSVSRNGPPHSPKRIFTVPPQKIPTPEGLTVGTLAKVTTPTPTTPTAAVVSPRQKLLPPPLPKPIKVEMKKSDIVAAAVPPKKDVPIEKKTEEARPAEVSEGQSRTSTDGGETAGKIHIPDKHPDLWTVDDVFAWVNVVAGPKSAVTLRDAGVDGIILLFSSGDWAELFSLKYGPICKLDKGMTSLREHWKIDDDKVLRLKIDVPTTRPDEWDVEFVRQWAAKVTSSEEAAEELYEQEVDGQALQMISTKQLQDDLKMKYGPAKKIVYAIEFIKKSWSP